GGSGVLETFLNVSVEPASPRYLKKVLEQQSVLVRATTVGPARPGDVSAKAFDATTGDDGGELVDNDVLGDEARKTGINALLKADICNILCLPPLGSGPDGTDIAPGTWAKASKFCADHRAFLIVDAPNAWDVTAATDTDPTKGVGVFSALDRNHSA